MHMVKDREGGDIKIADLNTIKIVVTDLDGTLLNSKSALSDANLQSILKTKENGVRVFFATGRTVTSVKGLLGDVLVKHNISVFPGVYLNGSTTYDEKEQLLVNRYIPEDLKNEIFSFIKQHNLNKRTLWYDNKGNYCIELNKYTESVTKLKDTTPKVMEEEEIQKLTVYQICLCLDPENFGDIYKKCKDQFSEKLSVRNSLGSYVEMFHKHSNKYEGIKKICEFYNTSVDHVLVCGDGENDIEMLKEMKYSVAVDNASSQVKKAAKYLGPNNDENAVFHILRAFGCI